MPSVIELLDRRAAEGGPPFLSVCGRDISAEELAGAATAIDGFLASLGIVPGDRVGLFFENCHEAVIALMGTLRAGAIAVPINAALRGRFLEHVLADSGARVVFCQADLLDRLHVTLASSRVEHVVVAGGDVPPAAEHRSGITYWPFEGALAAPPRHGTLAVSAEDTAVCLYTGGTTGPSKGCVLSHVALVHHAITPAGAYGRTADDVFFTPLPLFHLNAIKFGVIGGLLSGGRSVISKKFSLSGFWNEIAASKATIANLLGSMAALIARSPHERHDDTLRLMIAVPLPQDADALLRSRFRIETWSGFYGMTECSTIGLLPHGVPHRTASCGLVNEDYEVRILDEGGNEVPRGEAGEIVARPRRPDIMFKGYWNRPEETLRAFRDLWFRSGDIGRIDADGYLYFVDRKGDYLRRRGENVSTTEAEAVLVEHPAVVEVAVHAVPSDIAEDDIKVTAVLKPGAELEAAAFFEWMRERLPYFALPSYIEFRPDLPRSPVGRVLKRELRAEGVTPETWSRDAAGAVFERR